MQDFELWWLLVFPVFFGLGWLAARVDMREVLGQAKHENLNNFHNVLLHLPRTNL